MMMDTRLKLCLFCGGEAVMTHTHHDDFTKLPCGKLQKTGLYALYMVRCGKCGASSDYDCDEKEVARSWNSRADDVAEQEMQAAVRLRAKLWGILEQIEEIVKDA